MENQPKKTSKIKIVLYTLLLIVCAWYFFGGGIEKQAQNQVDEISNQVALDAEKQYDIAKRHGDKMQTYVQAGMVAAAYLQAKDEANYQKWKEIEKTDGVAAGITQ